jgi:tRNA threonylcarbamoyladenosine biosynthesis protein TsaB
MASRARIGFRIGGDDRMGAAYTDRMDAPRLLAIDTAIDRMVVAVVAGDQTLCAEEAGGARASLRLLPLVFELLEQAALQPSQLDAVAFGRGPGAFTGLRTACAVAQGLALGAGCPVLPIDSLALVAEDSRLRHGVTALWVAMDARMDEVYAGAFRFDAGRWHASQGPALYTLPALQAAWRADPPAAVAGSALAAFGDRLPCDGAQRWPDVGSDRAAALACLARAAWQQGGAVDAALALPLYLRDKVALTTAERNAARALTAAGPP